MRRPFPSVQRPKQSIGARARVCPTSDSSAALVLLALRSLEPVDGPGVGLTEVAPDRTGVGCTSPWVGVDLARDHVAWARLVRCAYDVTLSGRGTPAVLRDVIVRSWARCVEAGVDPERPAPRVCRRSQRRGRSSSMTARSGRGGTAGRP
jgi:hypothetical protein